MPHARQLAANSSPWAECNAGIYMTRIISRRRPRVTALRAARRRRRVVSPPMSRRPLFWLASIRRGAEAMMPQAAPARDIEAEVEAVR